MDRFRSSLHRVSLFFNGPLFDTAFKSKMHCIQMTLTVIVISLAGARLATKPRSMPVMRSDTLGIVMVSHFLPKYSLLRIALKCAFDLLILRT